MNSYPLLTDKKKRRTVALMIAGWLKRRSHFREMSKKCDSHLGDAFEAGAFLEMMAFEYGSKAKAVRQVLMELFE